MNWLQLKLQCQLRVNWQSAQWLHVKSSQIPQNYHPSPAQAGNHFPFPARQGDRGDWVQFRAQCPIPILWIRKKEEYFSRLTWLLRSYPVLSWPTAAVEQLLFYTFLIRFLPANGCLAKVWLAGATNLEWNSLNTCQKYSSGPRNWILSCRCRPQVGHMCTFALLNIFRQITNSKSMHPYLVFRFKSAWGITE